MAQVTDLEFISDPSNWPRWPTLTVVNLASHEAGFMISEGKPKIYHKNIFELVEGNLFAQVKDVKISEYSSFEELLKEWRID